MTGKRRLTKSWTQEPSTL